MSLRIARSQPPQQPPQGVCWQCQNRSLGSNVQLAFGCHGEFSSTHRTHSWLFNIKLPNLVNVKKLCLVRISSCMHIQHTTHTLDTIHIAKASNTNKQLAWNTCHSTCHSSHFLASSLWSAHGLLSHAIVLVVFVIINIEVGQTINHTKSGFDYFFSFDYRKFHFKSPTALQVFIIEDSNKPELPSNNLEASFMLVNTYYKSSPKTSSG